MNEDPGSSDRAPALPGLPEGRLQGRHLFADLIRQSLATAAAEGWPHVVLCDNDFSDWPLGERAVVASLQAWARRGRVLQVLGRDLSSMRLQHPRFVQWRVVWAHIVEVRACSRASVDEWPSVLWSSVWTLERIDTQHGVMVASRDARRLVALSERMADWWSKASPSLPPTTLGL